MKKKLSNIKAFQGKYAPFSNFYPCLVMYEGMTFPSAEHAFQAAKTIDRNERIAFATCPTAKEVKELGRSIQLRPDWEEIKVQVMTEVVKDKFIRNQSDQDIRALLLRTGDAFLEEANSHGDRFWGTVAGEGKNWLGKILMEVRGELLGQEKTREELTEKWEQLRYGMNDISLEMFRILFWNTWKYLTVRITNHALPCVDTALTNYLAMFSAYNDYPDSVKPWEFDACLRFAEAVLNTIAERADSFADGMILVEVFMYEHDWVKISDFESFFASLCDRYKDEVYADEE